MLGAHDRAILKMQHRMPFPVFQNFYCVLFKRKTKNHRLKNGGRASWRTGPSLFFYFDNFIGTYCPKGVGHELDSRFHARCPPT